MRTLLQGVALAVAVLASGCANITPRMQSLPPSPSDRVAAFRVPTEGAAEVHVMRPSSFAGVAINYQLSLDGQLAAAIGSGERVTLYVPPGEHLLELRHPSQILGATGDSASFTAVREGRYYFVINSDIGSMRLLRTTAGAVGE